MTVSLKADATPRLSKRQTIVPGDQKKLGLAKTVIKGFKKTIHTFFFF